MALIDIAVRAAVMLATAWLVAMLMRRAAAATRHHVWTLAVVGALVMPFATAALPAWHLDLLPAQAGDSEEAAPHVDAHTVNPAPTSVPRDASINPAWVVLAWFTVAIVLLARVGAGIVAVRRLARHARPADARWRERFDAAAALAQVHQRVRLLVSRDIAVPMTWGGRRPFVLLPQEALDWADDRASVVLLHELGHVRRADWLTHVAAQVLASLHWFNPLAWVALRAMTRERERACDDFVLAHGARPSEYAQHLLDIARGGAAGARYAMAPAMARPSELEGRLLSILTPRHRVARRLVTQSLTAAAVGASLAIATAARHDQAPAAASAIAAPVPAASDWVVQLDDPPEEKRAASRARAGLQPLADAALTSRSEDTREKATLALALRSEPGVVDPLLRALKDPSSQVREKAALGLALRREARVVDSLLEAAADPDSQVREKVAIALGLSGDRRAIDALNKHLEDPDPQVREKAASGLMLFSLSSRAGGTAPKE
jgi:beta-lactamase regulating signal transducer with metallopeptidase domain